MALPQPPTKNCSGCASVRQFIACQCLPFGHDAVLDGTRSGLPGVAVGGAFYSKA